MSWRDRDWARLNDDERAALFGGGSTLPRECARARLTLSVPGGWHWAVGAAAALGFFGYVGTHSGARTAAVRPPAAPVASRRNVVPVRWRYSDVSPAATSGQICIDAGAHGRVCAAYAVGERPADSLIRRLAQLGLQVAVMPPANVEDAYRSSS